MFELMSQQDVILLSTHLQENKNITVNQRWVKVEHRTVLMNMFPDIDFTTL